MSRDTNKYGRFYWCVGLKDEDQTEILAMADEISVGPEGALSLLKKSESGNTQPNLIIAPGEWAFCYAASVLDGHAVAVDHWPGQIEDTPND